MIKFCPYIEPCYWCVFDNYGSIKTLWNSIFYWNWQKSLIKFDFFLFFFPDLEFSESEENNDYETLHLGKGVDFLANVTKQNFTDTPTGKNIIYLQIFFSQILKKILEMLRIWCVCFVHLCSLRKYICLILILTDSKPWMSRSMDSINFAIYRGCGHDCLNQT